MKISDLLEGISILDTRNATDLEIENIHYHSKKIQKNSLFVCIRGYKVDGHDYIKSAEENGATALIVEEFKDTSTPQYLVKDSRKALALLSDNFYHHPSKDLHIIGITATNGKTTTSFMINSIFEEYQLNTGIIGTVFLKYADVKIPSILTTPESMDLHYHFNEMRKKDVTHVIMEVSSSALELSRTVGTDFNIVTLNNISREHILSHGSFENYFKYKSSLITEAGKKAFAILNLDDEYSKSLISKTEATVLTYGIEDTSGDLYIKNLDLSTGFGKFTVYYKDISFDINLSVPGYHSVYNSLVAILAAIYSNIPIDYIKRGIENFKGIERRFELIYDYDFKIIDDHFANSGNIDVTMKTIEYMDYDNMHLVYAIRGSRGYTVNKENALAIAKWLKILNKDEIIATKSIDHVMDKDKVTKEEEEVFLEIMKKNNIKVSLYDTIKEATNHALNIVKKDDLILLAGCQGMDYGCNIILNQLESITDIPVKELKKPLEYRTAGVLDE